LQTESWKMTDVEPVVSDFEATGRTGRRNALPDILGSTAGPGAADLPDKLAELSVGGTVSHKDRITLDISSRN
uniref:Protein kinase (cAMP-dependent, catalytic) inhibitor beta n=1 Tax=Cyprinus carpio carpio TaxID=630221 RepID=A0A8C1DQU8_CYPCA